MADGSKTTLPPGHSLPGMRTESYWEQIATKMRDFDGHFMVASPNEPGTE